MIGAFRDGHYLFLWRFGLLFVSGPKVQPLKNYLLIPFRSKRLWNKENRKMCVPGAEWPPESKQLLHFKQVDLFTKKKKMKHVFQVKEIRVNWVDRRHWPLSELLRIDRPESFVVAGPQLTDEYHRLADVLEQVAACGGEAPQQTRHKQSTRGRKNEQSPTRQSVPPTPKTALDHKKISRKYTIQLYLFTDQPMTPPPPLAAV